MRICKGAIINFSRIKILIPIFVYDDLKQQLILKHSYYKKAHLKMWDNLDKICDKYIHSINKEKCIKFRVVIMNHFTNRELKSLMKNRSLK